MGNDNKTDKTRQDMLDDFWDLSELVPKRKNAASSFSSHKDTKGAEISKELPRADAAQKKNDPSAISSSVIKRYVNPLHYEHKKIRKEAYSAQESYHPENSLLHEVIIRKRKSDYELYSDFLESAKKYRELCGAPCEFVSYYSYVPQFDQLSKEQLSYYLWWRKCFEEGMLIETTYSYVLLYVYEIINLGERQDLLLAQRRLCDVWKSYAEKFVQFLHKLPAWICDFSLLHRLSAPLDINRAMLKHTLSLKEFFLNIPQGDYRECANALIKYASEYDYKTSKFYTDENRSAFDEHIIGALVAAVNFYSPDGVMLSSLHSEDSKLIRNVYEGALCCSEQRYEIEVRYSSFSRSNELRYIIADIIKYSENKIRTLIGIKSKLTVYSVPTELQKVIDAYFEQNFAPLPRSAKKKEEKTEYDFLYELPKKEFSLENAKKIESESWGVTQDLISAFEDDSDENLSTKSESDVSPTAFDPKDSAPLEKDLEITSDEDANTTQREKLSEYMPFINALNERDQSAAMAAAKSCGMLIDALVDRINEIASDEIGDILIEETDGAFEILECYLELI